ncbi:MAG: hypothetical protein WCX12_00480 [Candidatus Paceibacterota bacterium]|jgi:hypothetical protein
MKRFSITLMVVALVVTGCLSSTAATRKFSLSNEVLSSYIAGDAENLHRGPVNQTNFQISFRGFYVGLWSSTGLDGRPNSGREIDYTIGWANNVFSVGISRFDLNPLFSSKGGDIIQPFGEITISVSKEVSPFLAVEHLYVTKDPAKNSATSVAAGAKLNFQPEGSTVSFSHNLRVAYSDGVYGVDKGYIFRYEFRLNKEFPGGTFNLFHFRYLQPLSKMSDRWNEVAVGSGITFNF